MGEIHSEQLEKPEIIEIKSKPIYNTMTFSEVQQLNIELPKKVIGDLLYLNELTVLFSYNGRGKSICAFQFCISVATGTDLDLGNGIILDNECEPMNVIYFDFEMKEVQIKDRLGNKPLPDNLHRASLCRGAKEGENPRQVFEKIKKVAEELKIKFIVIDNMSAISSVDLVKSNEVKKFLDPLYQLTLYDDYTILIIGHTTLEADAFIPLEKKHLFGSSFIGNYMDAIIGIGMVNSDTKEYYIKQLKTRIKAEVYGKNNVIKVRIDKDNEGLTRYFGLETCNEHELLNNFSVNTPLATNREFFTIAYLYYGSSRKAQENLIKVGIKAPYNTIADNVRTFKDTNSKGYKVLEDYDIHTKYDWLNSKSPNQNVMLPRVKGHECNNDIPF